MNAYGERKYALDGGYVGNSIKNYLETSDDKSLAERTCTNIKCEVKDPTIEKIESLPDSEQLMIFCQGKYRLSHMHNINPGST